MSTSIFSGSPTLDITTLSPLTSTVFSPESSIDVVVVIVYSTTYSVASPILPLATIFTPPSFCFAPTFSLSTRGYGYDELHGNFLTRGSNPSCYPGGYVATTAVTQVPNSASTSPFMTAPTSVSEASPTPTAPFTIPNTTTTTSASIPTSITTSVIPSILTQSTISPAGCPASYTTATATLTIYNSQPFNLVTCCPPSMTPVIQTQTILSCVGDISDATVSYITSSTALNGSRRTLTTSTTGSYRLWAQAILALSPTTTPTSISTPPPAPPQGLSTGAKAGIGVGVSVGGLLIVALVVFALWRRKRRRNAHLSREEDVPAAFGAKAELPGETKQMAEMDNERAIEADPKLQTLEMETANVRAELPGDWVGHEAPTRETM